MTIYNAEIITWICSSIQFYSEFQLTALAGNTVRYLLGTKQHMDTVREEKIQMFPSSGGGRDRNRS